MTMKNILLISFLLFSAVASAQIPIGGKLIPAHGKSDVSADSVLSGPQDTLSRAPVGSFGYKNGQFYGKGAIKWGSLGGGGTPGGNTTNMQFNSGGSFSGQDNFSVDTAHKAMIIQTPSLGTTAPTGGPYGLFIKNPTAAVSGPGDQYSPPLHLQGQTWNSTASASQASDWFVYDAPSGGATPTHFLRFIGGLNGSYTANRFILCGNGFVHFNSLSTNVAGESPVTITEGNVSNTGYPNFFIKTSDNQGADVGAIMGLGGSYQAGGILPFGLIRGAKENATSGNYSSYMAFLIRKNAIGVLEGMRINSNTHLLSGQTGDSANAQLQVAGGVWIKPDSVITSAATTNLMIIAQDTTTGTGRGRLVKVPVSALPGGGSNSTKFSQTADGTLTNSASTTSIIGTGSGSQTISANTLAVGDRILVKGFGYISTDASIPTLTITFANSSSFSANGVGGLLSASMNNAPIEWEYYATVRSTGSGGTIQLNGWVSINGTKAYLASSAASAFNTTANQTFDVTAQFGTASTNNTIVSKQTFIRVN